VQHTGANREVQGVDCKLAQDIESVDLIAKGVVWLKVLEKELWHYPT
jgi:hypothetical protein